MPEKYISLINDKIEITEYIDSESIELVSRSFHTINDAVSFLVTKYTKLPKYFQDKVDELFRENPTYAHHCLDTLYGYFERSM